MTRDPEKKRAIWRRYYARHREYVCRKSRETYHRHRGRRAAQRKAAAERRTQFLKDLRASTPCADCGQQFVWYVMQFDHVRGTKRASVTSLTGNTYKMLFAEIAKCEIVCANCHSVRTYTRRQGTLFKTLHPKRGAA